MAFETPEIIEFTRVYLAVFYSMVAAFYTVRIIRMKRETSREFVFPGSRFSCTWWNHMAFRFFRLAIWMVCLIRVFFPSLDDYLGIITPLAQAGFIITGALLLTFGFVATVAVHFRFGNQWRSGIDPAGPKNIIENGLYQYSRNPMFCFVAIAQLGFFLALPSVFSLVCLAIGILTLDRQAKAEEVHLLERFPTEYALYKGKVRRWV